MREGGILILDRGNIMGYHCSVCVYVWEDVHDHYVFRNHLEEIKSGWWEINLRGIFINRLGNSSSLNIRSGEDSVKVIKIYGMCAYVCKYMY